MNPGPQDERPTPAGMQQARDAVAVAIRQVLRDTGREAAAVEPPMLLGSELGLDSLDLAQTVVLLERSLGIDPFRGPAPASGRRPLRTVSDLVEIYLHALEHPPPGS